MTIYSLTIGLNDKDTKKQELETDVAMRIIKGLALERFVGVTVMNCIGGYTHDDGTKVEEKSIRVELVRVEEKQVKAYVNDIKKALNQESIMVSKVETNIDFW